MIMKIAAKSLHKLVRATLEFEFSESGSSNSVTVPFIGSMLERVEIVSESGSGVEVQRIYDDNFLINLAIGERYDAFKKYAKHTGVDEKYAACNNSVIPAGATRRFQLPLVGSWIDSVQPYMQAIASDIWLRIYCKSTNLVSGSGTLRLDNVRLICEQEDHNGLDRDTYQRAHSTFNVHQRYSEAIRVEDTSSWTASTKKTINLDDVQGKVSFIVFGLRASKATTANAYKKWVSLGDNATVDLVDQTGRSYFGNGSPPRLGYLRQLAAELLPEGELFDRQSMYVLPLCENIQAALYGVVNNYHEFQPNSKWRLEITPAAAVTNAVVTFNCTNAANDGGAYRLQWAGESTGQLAFNADAAAMKAAFETLSMFREYPNMAVTFSGAATTDFTMTISGVDFDAVDKWGLPSLAADSLAGGGVGEICAVSVTTYFQSGFVSSGSLICSVYAYHAKESVLLSDSGKILAAVI